VGGFGNNGIHSADVRVQGKFSFPIVVALQLTAAVADSMAGLQQRLDRVRLPESLRLAPSDERYVLHGRGCVGQRAVPMPRTRACMRRGAAGL
jgi:hypothetical protein